MATDEEKQILRKNLEKYEGKVSSIKHLVIIPALHKLTLRRRLGLGQLSPIAADAAEHADT